MTLSDPLPMKPQFPVLRPHVHRWHSEWRRQFLVRGAEATSEMVAESSAVRSPKMARVEAALFVANGALSLRKIAQHALLADAAECIELIQQLNRAYDTQGTVFRIEQVATGYQMLTRPEFVGWLDRIHHRQERQKLTPAASETLAIIAYRQPITRADVEAVRGVQSAEMIKQLMDRGYVRVTGEDDSLGRPFLYGTTKQFLEAFGLQSLDELPMSEELARQQVPQSMEDENVVSDMLDDELDEDDDDLDDDNEFDDEEE
ncbi:MAG: SMC-Scp complex subunit ScpB [Planctomycetaceae bacterium]|nr:SMC-Scp complex subunit ScpB [Planctomycetaceae bacterium]